MKWLLQTDEGWSGLILRVTLGIVMFPHGAQKLLGWYGGMGFTTTISVFSDKMGIPALLTVLVIVAESFGAVGLMAGLLTRLTSFGLALVMLGAIWLVHWPHGFFMNWFGQQQGEGYEYHLLVLGICAALMILGSGKWSIDQMLAQKMKN